MPDLDRRNKEVIVSARCMKVPQPGARPTDPQLRRCCRILDLYPDRYWRETKYLSDLTHARRFAEQIEAGIAPNGLPEGFPIFGAIAIKISSHEVALFFQPELSIPGR